MQYILWILFFGLGFATIFYRYGLYKITGDWEWAMKFLGANGTIVAIILIGAILMFIGVAYPFGVFENLDPRIVPTWLSTL